MAQNISVPDIGDFKDVEVIEVLVKPGDQINKNDPIVTIESDKSSVEIPSPAAGEIKDLKVKIGDKVSEGSVLATIENGQAASAPKEKNIVKEVSVPIVADIHFHYKRAIEAAEMGASCLRINPGNIGTNDRILEVVKAAKNNDCSIRIGVNAGSLEKANALMEAMQQNNVGYLAVSLGFYKTLFSAPGTSTSSEIPEEEQVEMGLSDGLIRFSIGLDNNIERTYQTIKKCMKEVGVLTSESLVSN